MKGKGLLAIGAGLAYLYGTESGRQNLAKAKQWVGTTWQNPSVQQTVKDVETRLSTLIREQGSQLGDRIAAVVRDATGAGAAKVAPSADEVVVEPDGTVRQP